MTTTSNKKPPSYWSYNKRLEWLKWRDAWRPAGRQLSVNPPSNAGRMMTEWRKHFPSVYADIKAGRNAKLSRNPRMKFPSYTDPRQLTLPLVDRQRGKALSPWKVKMPRRKLKRPDAQGCVAHVKVGSYNPPYTPNNPFDVCITRTQWKTLFPKSPIGKVPKKLGSGSFATAWARTRDTVTKITNDPSDALAYKKATEAHVPGIPKLHGLYRIASPTDSDEPVFAMTVERLKGTMEDLYPKLRSPLGCVRNSYSDYSKADLKDVCCDDDRMYGATPKDKKMCHKLMDQVPDTLEALDSIGIESAKDLHIANIGVTLKNDWAVLDLGLSGLRQRAGSKVAQSLKGAGQGRKR